MAATPLVLRADPELHGFLPRALRTPGAAVGWDGDATVGHVVQSVGVPLTEVGALVLDGVPVPP